MTKTLVIAEKPSQARDIARVLGGMVDKKGYFEGGEHVVTSAIGHLLEIYNPDEDEPRAAKGRASKSKGAKASKTGGAKKPGKWSFESLPCLPPDFALKPTKEGADRLRLIVKLAKRDDIGSMINACDAGREGELIFRHIEKYLGDKAGVAGRPVKRLWLQSMTPEAIRRSFDNLRDASELENLAEAAVARSRADWLVGINVTRALTALNSQYGGFVLTTAGRVQTPTLSLLVLREQEREAHEPRDYCNLLVRFEAGAGLYDARWVGVQPDGADARRDRIWDEDQAQKLLGLASPGAAGKATDKSKDRKMAPPGMYDLNGLQRDANRHHSLPARVTQGAAQALYEKYKLLTYPRTESRFLPGDYISVCEKTLRSLSGADSLADVAAAAKGAVAGVAKAGRRVFDDAKVTDHFAIIPTGQIPNDKLPDLERKVYDLVVRRFVAAFMPPALVRETVRTTTIGDETFEAKGRVVVETGWLAVARREGKEVVLPQLAAATEQVQSVDAKLEKDVTKPPPRYNDASLLGAMQGAYKLVEEKDLAEYLSAGGGLGTPATRAGIIENLVFQDYVVRGKGEHRGALIATSKAKALFELLTAIGSETLTKPQLTGEWEGRLKAIEEGDDHGDAFLGDIREFVKSTVAKIRAFDPDDPDTASGATEPVTLSGGCPKCGGTMKEGYVKYSCQKCGYFFWRTSGNRMMTAAEADLLLAAGRAGPYDDFKSRFGAPFTATMVLEWESGKINLEFESDETGDIDEEAMANMQEVGDCPVKDCGAKVLATGTAYSCRRLLSKDGERECKFSLRTPLLKREITPEEATAILAGESPLLEKFISKRGRPFSARLSFDGTGKLSWEFEDMKGKGAKKGPGSKKS